MKTCRLGMVPVDTEKILRCWPSNAAPGTSQIRPLIATTVGARPKPSSASSSRGYAAAPAGMRTDPRRLAVQSYNRPQRVVEIWSPIEAEVDEAVAGLIFVAGQRWVAP